MSIAMTNHCHFPSHHLLRITKDWPTTSLTARRLFHVCSRFPTVHASTNHHLPQSSNVKLIEKEDVDEGEKVRVLRQKLELLGIKCDDSCLPGFYNHLLCPKCKGGKCMETSLSLHIVQDEDFAMWRCYQSSCGWAGRASAEDKVTVEGFNIILKIQSSKELTAEGTHLEPLGEKLLAYFGERMISAETLRRNAVMQKCSDQAIVAFTYRQNGVIVGCKYRKMEKKFWQDKGTAKWLYGLDDITKATEVIIVEGEIDKLSVEEAGFRNCVSVPTGAPKDVSTKDMPSLEKDKAYHYLWNCKEYLDKLSRILLATDSDTCGQALAKELARRLGKERCWLVHWPKKDDSYHFKDANEVLKCLGPTALREAILNAKPYLDTR